MGRAFAGTNYPLIIGIQIDRVSDCRVLAKIQNALE